MNTEYKQKKNLTRFTYENTAFQGWRLCISREGKTFVKYFSDKKYGCAEGAQAAAEEALERILNVFETSLLKHGRITKDCLIEAEQSIR